MHQFFSRICDNLLILSSWLFEKKEKLETWLKKAEDNFIVSFFLSIFYPTHIAAKGIVNEFGEPLNYREEAKRGSKCYLILLSPLVIVTVISIFSAIFSFAFTGNTILFFDEYVKLIPLIIPSLIIFLWIMPALFFKFIFPKGKKNIQVYTYSTLVAIITPLLIIPQDYHYYYGKDIDILGTVKNVYNNSHKQKMNSITFSSHEKKLNKIKLKHLSSYLTNNAKIGEQYLIKGKKSKFYFTYESVTKLH